jgi:hypothetical protein
VRVEDIAGIGRIVQDGDAAQGGHGGFEQLEPFAGHLDSHNGQPRDVPTGTSQAFDQACGDRVGRQAFHHNGDRRGRLLGRQDPHVPDATHHNEVNVEPDEVRRERGEEGDVAFRVAVLQDDVLSLHISQFP